MRVGISGTDENKRIIQAQAGLGIAGEVSRPFGRHASEGKTEAGAMFGISGIGTKGNISAAVGVAGPNTRPIVASAQGAMGIAGNFGSATRNQAAIDKLMAEISREAGHGYGSKDRVAQLKSHFERLVDQKRDAYRVFAKLVDDQRVRMLAIKMLATSVGYSATHREKDTKLGMMVQNIDALIHDLTGIDKDHPSYYEYGFRHNDIGSWDYAKAITQLHHENSRVKRMEEEIEALKKKLGKYEPAENGKSEPVEEDQIRF